MAATRLIALHINKGKTVAQCLNERLDYSQNPIKTEKGELISSYACDPETAAMEFLLSKRQYQQVTGQEYKGNIIAYQIRQSFKPGEITPEEANRLGYELAMHFTKGNHAFTVSTHTDRAHIHNHIIFNSTTLDYSRKFKNFFFSGIALQRLSDIVCFEHGYSIIERKPYADRTKRTEYPKRHTVRNEIWSVLDDLIRRKPKDWEDFLQQHDIHSYEDLERMTNEAATGADQLLASIKEKDARIKEIEVLRQHIFDYSKTRKIYLEYKRLPKAKKAEFYELHRAEIELQEAARTAFDQLPEGTKLPSVKELNAERTRLLREHQAEYVEYRKAKADRTEFIRAKQNADVILRRQQEERDEKMQEKL